MRHTSLRLILTLTAAAAAMAAPVLAQEAPTPDPAPAQIDPPLRTPTVVLAPGAEEAPDAAPESWAPVAHDELGRSAYGLYLAGRLALSRGEQGEAARYLTVAQELEPEQAGLRQQAFVSSMFGGDLSDAARTAPSVADAPAVLSQAGRLIDAAVLLSQGEARTALARLDEAPIGVPHARAGVYLRPFVEAAAGREPTFQTPRPSRDRTDLFLRRNQALTSEARGRFDETDAQYQALMADPTGALMFRQAYGEFLERRGRRAEAVALYDAGLAERPDDAGLKEARERAARRGRPPAALTLEQGAAEALSVAALQASMEGAHEFAALYLRLAVLLDPKDDYRLMLGQTLGEAELEPAARTALSQVGTSDPALYAAARATMALSFDREERTQEALAEAQRAFTANPRDAGIAYLTAALLAQEERYDEALAILNGPVLNTADQTFETRFLRGAAYESLGQVEPAEAELWAALQLNPDDPTVLNYLGYLWVDSGRRVEQGAEMIERAFAAEPGNGHIQDSLGWAQYRRGLYDEAVVNLEAAVDKEPASAEINDHLGDAYWQVGRRREARFQWTRALSLEIDDERRADAEHKLEHGLTPPTPVAEAGAADSVAVASAD